MNPVGALAVAVVEDHPMYRRAVVAALGGAPDLEVVLSCASIEEFEAGIGATAVEVVVLDLRLPGVDGAEGVRRIVDRGLGVLVLSATAPGDDVVAVLAAGARGYLTKAADADEIVQAVRAVGRGESYVAPAATTHLLTALRGGTPGRPNLSAREREVLALVAAGRTDQAIASELVIGLTTVRSHLDNIRDKTGRRRRAELTRLAYEEGLVDGHDSRH